MKTTRLRHANDKARVPKRLTRVPKFLQALYRILENESDHIIAWNACGTYFQVHDVHQLEQYILPRYFRHNKFGSFQRQLNNFGFRKWTKTRAMVCTFSHNILVRCSMSELPRLVQCLRESPVPVPVHQPEDRGEGAKRQLCVVEMHLNPTNQPENAKKPKYEAIPASTSNIHDERSDDDGFLDLSVDVAALIDMDWDLSESFNVHKEQDFIDLEIESLCSQHPLVDEQFSDADTLDSQEWLTLLRMLS